MQPRKRYVRPDRPAAELTEDDLRELGRRLFDKINIDRLDDQVEKDLEEEGGTPPASDVT